MIVRWTSAAIVEAEKKFRRVQGWLDIEKLVRALDVLEAGQQDQKAKAERVGYDLQIESPLREDQRRGQSRPPPSSSRALTMQASAGSGAEQPDQACREPIVPRQPNSARGRSQ